MRTKKRPIVDFHGVRGEGIDKTEAKLHAIKQIREAFEGDYTPEILEYRGHVILLYRAAVGGWAYSTIMAPDRPIKTGALYTTSYCGGDYRKTKDFALFSLAQSGWTEDDGADYLPGFLTNKEDQDTSRDMQAIWMLQAEAKRLGFTGMGISNYADHKRGHGCYHPHGHCQKEGLGIPQAA